MRNRPGYRPGLGAVGLLGGALGLLPIGLGGCRISESPQAEDRNQLAVAAAIVNTTFRDASGRIEIMVKACDPTGSANTNCAYCTVDEGYARIGGGAQILGEAAGGAMLQASFPDPNFYTGANSNGCTGPAGNPARRPGIDDQATWATRASGASHRLQAYVIQMRMLGSNGSWFRPQVTEARDRSATSVNPPANFQVEAPEWDQPEAGLYMLGGGAYVFKGDGNKNQATPTDAYLVGSYPVNGANGRAWRAVARSQANPAPLEALKAFGIFLNRCPPELSPKCISYPEIQSIAAAATSGYGTASRVIPGPQIVGSIGGYSPTSSGGARYLADLIPLSGTGQGFTVRSKAFGTGTGSTTGYALTFHVPSDIYTVYYLHSNKCMGVLNARTDATAPVAQQTCTFGNEPSHLRFSMVPFAGGYRALKFEHSGLCVDINGASPQNSAAAIQYPCSFADNQLVQLIRNADGSQSFKFKHSGKCLDVEAASQIDGARFIQYTCNGQANQSFYWDD